MKNMEASIGFRLRYGMEPFNPMARYINDGYPPDHATQIFMVHPRQECRGCGFTNCHGQCPYCGTVQP